MYNQKQQIGSYKLILIKYLLTKISNIFLFFKLYIILNYFIFVLLLQSIREEHVGIHENVNLNYEDPANIDHEITTGSQLEKAKKLLSWECYNFILLGLTNEIIELGAKPSLKIIVLQLWVQYLQFIEVAFTSKKFKKLPKLNTSINNV